MCVSLYRRTDCKKRPSIGSKIKILILITKTFLCTFIFDCSKKLSFRFLLTVILTVILCTGDLSWIVPSFLSWLKQNNKIKHKSETLKQFERELFGGGWVNFVCVVYTMVARKRLKSVVQCTCVINGLILLTVLPCTFTIQGLVACVIIF